MVPNDYLKYLSENIASLNPQKQKNLQLVVEDFINDVVDIDELSEAAVVSGLFDLDGFRKDILYKDIFGD